MDSLFPNKKTHPYKCKPENVGLGLWPASSMDLRIFFIHGAN